MNLDELLDAWRVNNALNQEWLDKLTDEDLDLKPGKGKTCRSNFVHLITTRRAWVEERKKDLAKPIPKLDWKTATRGEIADGLARSSRAMEEMLRMEAEREKPTRWTLGRLFAYCIAHEAHHRSQIEIALRLAGKEPDISFLYGHWDWPKKKPLNS